MLPLKTKKTGIQPVINQLWPDPGCHRVPESKEIDISGNLFKTLYLLIQLNNRVHR